MKLSEYVIGNQYKVISLTRILRWAFQNISQFWKFKSAGEMCDIKDRFYKWNV